MIELNSISPISSIYLTVTLIIYLMIVELGNEKMKRALLPAVIIMTAVFLIIVVMSVYAQVTH